MNIGQRHRNSFWRKSLWKARLKPDLFVVSLSQELNQAFVDRTGDQCGNPSAAQKLRDQVTQWWTNVSVREEERPQRHICRIWLIQYWCSVTLIHLTVTERLSDLFESFFIVALFSSLILFFAPKFSFFSSYFKLYFFHSITNLLKCVVEYSTIRRHWCCLLI